MTPTTTSQELEKGNAAVRRIETVSQMLAAILLQDVEVERKAEGGDGEPVEQVKIRHNPSGQRICSATDPEMRHGRKSASKRFDGHKLGLGVDVESQLIAGVDVLAGSAADDEGSLELAQASAEALDYCARPVELDCHFESICESCTYFVTTNQFRPTLQAQREDAAAKGQIGRLKVFDRLLARLDAEPPVEHRHDAS